MAPEEVMALLMTLVIISGVVMLWMAMQNRRHIRELQHKERMAMIERGIAPPPELDPEGFERTSGVKPARTTQSAPRARSAGILMIGFGLALMTLITMVSGSLSTGLGIGGAFALLGGAVVLNSVLMERDKPDPWPVPLTEPRRSNPPEPPSNVTP